MTPRELVETMARALCEADNGFQDDPVWRGSLPFYRNDRLLLLSPMTAQWASEIVPMWFGYIADAHRAAVAAGLIDTGEHIDFSDVPTWQLVKTEKEAKT